MRILPVRAGHVLVELAGLDQVLALSAALEDDPVPGLREIVPAARTLLVSFDIGEISEDALIEALAARAGGERKRASGALIEIPVRYDGEDLPEVAGLLGMSIDDVVRLHTQSEYVVAFMGFAPGFGYLAGGDPRLTVPRRLSPRTQVPEGAVGLAGEFSGVYPKASPGGWQLIGSTPLAMFDIERNPASLLQPGSRVRFRNMAEDGVYEVGTPAREHPPLPYRASPLQGGRLAGSDEAAIEILSTGLPVLFQDLGRAGQAGQGISVSGAADRASFKAANRLVGNPAGAAALEITLGGLSFAMRGRGVMAVTGAEVAITVTDARGRKIALPMNSPVALDDGDVVSLGVPVAGMRSYLVVRGGFDVAPVLASCATDTLAQIGPAALKAGDVVGIRTVPAGTVVSLPESPAFAMPAMGATVVLDVVLGPRTDWFTDAAVQNFLSQEWTVTPQSSRVGIRLAGEALERKIHAELPSEATVRGAVQVPASGQPVLFLTDHPLTGGYPVIANVAAHHLDLAGQIPVGARIRFHAAHDFAPRIISGKSA
ncbi:5-oxoprolinase subunit PxpB [Brucella sp. IR073]|uniref:5-oxoprolinase subunit PxpB n=1 Tax=unclassified Brucella TaxID=2632610 RepID=UPI003B9853E5